ncbi:MAG: hypothetical protein ACLSV6_01680 [Butyricicoccus sp.]
MDLQPQRAAVLDELAALSVRLYTTRYRWSRSPDSQPFEVALHSSFFSIFCSNEQDLRRHFVKSNGAGRDQPPPDFCGIQHAVYHADRR